MASLRDPDAERAGLAFSVVRREAGGIGRSVRTDRYRFTEWPDGSEELYDHATDPNEYDNIAAAVRNSACDSCWTGDTRPTQAPVTRHSVPPRAGLERTRMCC